MSETNKAESVRTLMRGLQVIEAFGMGERSMTPAQSARLTGLSRATASRLLSTLQEAGYVTFDGRSYSLTPRILSLSFPFLAQTARTDTIIPFMEDALRGMTAVSSSAAMLDDTAMVYVAGVPANGHFRTWMTVGTRVPAHASAMGRAVLSVLEDAEREAILERSDFRPITPFTLTEPDAIRAALRTARDTGFGLCDKELDVTIRSCALPVFTRDGRCWGAISASCLDPGRPLTEFLDQSLPRLKTAAAKIAANLPADA